MKVKIKTWEELERKYGLDKFGDIERWMVRKNGKQRQSYKS